MTTTTPTSGAADLPEALRIANVLDLAKQIDYYNHVQDDLEAAAAELRRLHALTRQQQRDLIAESHRTAEQKLRADQMTTQHAHQAALNTEARAQLAAALTAQAISTEPAWAGYAELRSSMCYIAAFDPDEVEGMSKERLEGRVRSIINVARSAVASHGQAPAQTADSQLLQFYGVTTDAELIAAQAAHIEKLQAKLTKTPSFAPQRVREG